jgi:maltose alpha-D-glucosyltransferase/alpha-amylase
MIQSDQPVIILKECWQELYPGEPFGKLQQFIDELDLLRKELITEPQPEGWYKDAVVYSLYVDLFNKDFFGLESKLDYLAGLGVNCLWLLPILDSPMKDAGFDISDYRKIRADLLSLPETASDTEREAVFLSFLKKAHKRGIRVLFDIALNHTSDEHPWFQESRLSKDNPYRNYYIWSSDPNKYKDARIIFKGLCESNWQKDDDEFFFHRFFEFQPDLNYRNPAVLIEMAGHLVYWLTKGVDGFRADAVPYIWKEEDTACENLPGTHTIVRFLRAVLDYLRPNTLLLAEACQVPYEVVKYFGDGDECNAGYHFPLMPQIFKALALQSGQPIRHTLSEEVTPQIPLNAQWFTFLRCHDELSLELVYVTEEDRKYIHENYCRKPEWDFRLGQGISARLSELMDRDPRRIGLIYSVMLTLPGTPVIYYGDEFGKLNDESYYQAMISLTGKDDTRFLVRGGIDWQSLNASLADPDSYESKVFGQIRAMVTTRTHFKCFGRGSIEWLNLHDPLNNELPGILAYTRSYGNERVLVIQNLNESGADVMLPAGFSGIQKIDLLGNELLLDGITNSLTISSFGYYWISL